MSMFGLSPTHYSIYGNNTLFGMRSESSAFTYFYEFTNIIILKYLLLISWLWVSNLKCIHEKISFPTIMNLLRTKKKIGRFSWSQKPSNGKICFEPCFQLLKKNESGQIKKKTQQVYFGEKEGERISAIRNTVIHDAEILGLVPVLEPYSDKDSTMEQELANCHAVYDVATYKKRRMCVTIKKYSVNKPTYIQIRIFTANENEVLKQVAYVNYNLNEFKELYQVLGDFLFVESFNVQQFY